MPESQASDSKCGRWDLLPHTSQQVVLRESLLAVEQVEWQLQRLEQELAQAATTSVHAAAIAALQAL